MVGVEIANAPKLVGVSLVGIESFQDNDLVGLDPAGFVDGPRVQAPEPEVAFGSDDIEGSRFEDQLIEDPDIVDFAMGDNDEGGNASSEV